MKKFKLNKLTASVVLVSMMAAAAPSAYAKCCKVKMPKPKSIGNAFTSVGNQIAGGATNVGNQIAGGATNVGNQIAGGVTQLAKDGAEITQQEMGEMRKYANQAYSVSRDGVMQGYKQAVAAVEAAYYEVLKALFMAAGKVAIGQHQATLNTIQTKMKSLSPQAKEALNRIQRTIAKKELNEQARADMLLIGRELGLVQDAVNKNIPGNVARSSFGITVGGGSAVIVGVDESYSLVMNTFMENGKFPIGFTQSVGGSLGPSIGASAGGGLFWAPGSIDEATGASVGFTVEAALGPGASAGLSWSVAKGMKGAENAIPGFAMSFTPGAKLSAAFNGGYTQLIAKY